jgi:hypothetical protein
MNPRLETVVGFSLARDASQISKVMSKTTKATEPKAKASRKRPDVGRPMLGSEILVEALEREGVDTIFAYPGGASMELHQALTRSKQIRTILPRHEQGGAFAAEGYARATGKAGVCMATSGPGATNLVTGIADAYLDSIPLVAITGFGDARHFVAGDRGVSEWLFTGTTPDGKCIEVKGCDVFTFRNGKIAVKESYFKNRT